MASGESVPLFTVMIEFGTTGLGKAQKAKIEVRSSNFELVRTAEEYKSDVSFAVNDCFPCFGLRLVDSLWIGAVLIPAGIIGRVRAVLARNEQRFPKLKVAFSVPSKARRTCTKTHKTTICFQKHKVTVFFFILTTDGLGVE